MKKIYLFTALAAFAFVQTLSAQHRCGQPEAEELLKANPQMFEQIQKATEIQENWLKSFVDIPSGSRSADYIIPVVFHVFHNYGQENISDAQVQDAIRVMNEDFQLKNADTSNVSSAFKSILGNPKIEFRLAQLDPQGECTNGIVRIASTETYEGANYFNNSSTSSLSRWPREKYLNIWVVDKIDNAGSSGGYVAGYTYRPANTSYNLDGIMVLHSHTGSIGTSASSRSRTLTHEVGHWLALPHTWGNSNNAGLASNCSDDDGIADTPNTIGWFSGCNLNGVSCNTLDNVQNYMDYASCSIMFTAGQSTVLRAALTSSVAQRSSLWQNNNLISTGVLNPGNLCKADFNTKRTEVCSGQTVSYEDESYNNPSQWNWAFSGGSPSSSNLQNPSISYLTPGVYNVGLTVTNSIGSKSTTKNNFITVLDVNGKPGPLNESFENFNASNTEWFIKNPDGGATWALANVGSTGTNSMRINNFNNPANMEDELISNTLDLTSLNSLNISFNVAYAQKAPSNNDKLSLYVSSDCGENWILRWSRSGSDLSSVSGERTSAFTPTENEWKTFTIANVPTSYIKSNFRLKFNFTSGNGNNIYIDDVKITDPTVGIEKVSSNLKNLNIYPNPFANEAMVEFSLSQTEPVQMSITDMLGKEFIMLPSSAILQAGVHNFRINKSEMNLSPGIYFLKVISDGKPIVKKLIIQ
ncbi:MAG: T9SS type A sorting domain-containing protein [Bacteroidetes bacterium]|nr:T9SS type A sorting domain-containing protein [Bacteroidota bacterium]